MASRVAAAPLSRGVLVRAFPLKSRHSRWRRAWLGKPGNLGTNLAANFSVGTSLIRPH
jgi:hypothetical protein